MARILSKCTVKPASISIQMKLPYYLTPWDLPSLNYEYIQIGLLFNKPVDDRPIDVILDQLKSSLAVTLTHFFPLSGRLVTQTIQHPPSYCVYADCKNPAGVEFIHAVASEVTVSDILTPTDVPTNILESFFALPLRTPSNRARTIPFLVVQVTQLADGVFIGFSINHAIVDATSFWHFVNSYAEVCRSASQPFQNNRVLSLSRPPVFINTQLYVPGSHPPDLGIVPPPRSACRQRVFHFTSKSIARLKSKANAECGTREISSYQALAALVWRSTTRARGFRTNQLTTCAVPINCRSKLEPPLPSEYFGNCFMMEYVSSRVDELLSNNLGWAAWKLHDRITSCDSVRVNSYLEQFSAADCTVEAEDPGFLWFGSSPRFDIYGNDFGWGIPVAVRWCDDVVDGIVHALPGRDRGSVDLMVGLFSEFMKALESDVEFMAALSSAVSLSKI